jgi:hypothetical protein
MAQTGSEGEREEDIMTLGRKTQAGVGRVSKTGVMRVLCAEQAAVSMKRGKLQVIFGLFSMVVGKWVLQ